jgi:hypothetical protein
MNDSGWQPGTNEIPPDRAGSAAAGSIAFSAGSIIRLVQMRAGSRYSCNK